MRVLSRIIIALVCEVARVQSRPRSLNVGGLTYAIFVVRRSRLATFLKLGSR